MKIAVVTGCDAGMFWHAMLLLESARDQFPILVCDFGLEPWQRESLAAVGAAVLPVPPDLPDDRRSILYLKAALAGFVAGVAFDYCVWLDADTLACPGTAPALGGVVQDLAHGDVPVAACLDDCADFGRFHDRIAPTNDSLSVFRARWAPAGLGADTAYFNCGVLIADRAFLTAWQNIALAMTRHVALDQNSFNLALHAGGRHLALEPSVWNAHGAVLDQIAQRDGGPFSLIAGRPVQILHPTSMLGHVTRSDLTVTLPGGGGLLTIPLKLFNAPALRDRQLRALTAVLQRLPDPGQIGGRIGGRIGADRPQAD